MSVHERKILISNYMCCGMFGIHHTYRIPPKEISYCLHLTRICETKKTPRQEQMRTPKNKKLRHINSAIYR